MISARGRARAVAVGGQAVAGVRGPVRGHGLPLDLQQAALGLVLDLQGHVLDPEALAEHVAHLAPAGVAVVAGRDQQVGRQGGEAGGHLPQVQVVDLDHALSAAAMAWPTSSGSRPAGGGLQQHAPGVPQQHPRAAQHQRADHQRGDGVGAVEAEGEHRAAGGHRARSSRRGRPARAGGRPRGSGSGAPSGPAARRRPRSPRRRRRPRPAPRAPSTASGSVRRRTASTPIRTPKASSSAPLTWAERTSARPVPKV